MNKKVFLEAEAVNGGYFVFADQHANLITREGKLAYTTYYKPMVAVDLLSVAATVSQYTLPAGVTGSLRNLEQLNAMDKARRQTGGTAERRTSSASISAGGPSYELYNISTTRFTNSQQTKDHKFLTTRDEETGLKSLLMIDKNTGAITKKIDLKEKNPGYVVDVVDNVVFLTEADKTIRAYKMD